MALDSIGLARLQEELRDSEATWIAGPTSMSKLSDEEKLLRLGYTPGPDELSMDERTTLSAEHHQKWLAEKPETPEYAEKWDWRSVQGKDYVTSIKDQGECGSCVAFGVTATAEVRIKVIKNLPEGTDLDYTLPDLSPADLFYCSNGGATCQWGWNVESALSYFISSGVVPWSCFPYSATNRACNLCKTSAYQKTILSATTRFTDTNAMKSYLCSGGALITAFTVNENFYHYWYGVYRPSGKVVGNHCVCVIGYDDSQQAWLCKNSWGTGWGDYGYFWIAYGVSGIDALMWAVAEFSKIFSYPGLVLGGSSWYDDGVNPDVAINESAVVEVHKSQGNNGMWYRAASPQKTFGKSYHYDTGWHPNVGVNGLNQLVETHKSQARPRLFYHVGSVDPETLKVTWGPSHDYDDGLYPSVAINNSGTVVEVHQSQNQTTLWYHVGQLDFDKKTIDWGASYQYDRGLYPSVAINNFGQVVEVHQSQNQTKLWCHVGQVDVVKKTITFGSSQQYDDGIYPAVALTDAGQVFEVHQSQGATTLWRHSGWLRPAEEVVLWSGSKWYDYGIIPRIAVNNNGLAREVHQSQAKLVLWYHDGQIS